MSGSDKNKPGILGTDRRKVIAVIAGTSALIAASFGVQAVADSKPYQHLKLVVTEGDVSNPFMHKAGWRRGGHHGDWAKLSDEQIEKKVSRVVRHAAIEIDANDEQTRKITALLTAVAKDMRPLRDEFRSAGMAMKDLLLADKVDREALEKLRAERIAKADEVSRELLNAAADVADVLTPEQRKAVEKRVEEFRSWRGHKRGRWHRG